MAIDVIDNTEKYGNYRERFTRLKRAMRAEFYIVFFIKL